MSEDISVLPDSERSRILNMLVEQQIKPAKTQASVVTPPTTGSHTLVLDGKTYSINESDYSCISKIIGATAINEASQKSFLELAAESMQNRLLQEQTPQITQEERAKLFECQRLDLINSFKL